ncbi:hypothetical protein RHGRI_007841 [Rhododendron griersonianum]|uniref:Uncharacterized protein n=1 Tax=Rhododendron griersonianum TaxID=479676 RepID=A0AAV6KY69_9ERIC|nr:hypothetical protein RHGRI_007841 [Rhododendron griersonianum]
MPEVSALGALSPKNSSPARKLQEVFQQAGNRLELEGRISSLVRSLEAEMKNSGVLVDCSELKSQLNRLKEHHDQTGFQSSVPDACGKGKRDANSADLVLGKSSSSQPAIEDSNGIPSVLADLPNSVELQPNSTSEAMGTVVHALSNLDKGGQRAACEQSIQGQVDATTGSDSDVELLEVLERVVSSNQVSENLVHLKPPASLEVGSGVTPLGILGLHPLEVEGVSVQAGIKPPEPPDLLGVLRHSCCCYPVVAACSALLLRLHSARILLPGPASAFCFHVAAVSKFTGGSCIGCCGWYLHPE